MFGDAYDKCYEAVSVFAAWLLCWPMKLTFVCNLVQALGGSSICDPEGKVDSGIGEGYIALKGIIIISLILLKKLSEEERKIILYQFSYY